MLSRVDPFCGVPVFPVSLPGCWLSGMLLVCSALLIGMVRLILWLVVAVAACCAAVVVGLEGGFSVAAEVVAGLVCCVVAYCCWNDEISWGFWLSLWWDIWVFHELVNLVEEDFLWVIFCEWFSMSWWTLWSRTCSVVLCNWEIQLCQWACWGSWAVAEAAMAKRKRSKMQHQTDHKHISHPVLSSLYASGRLCTLFDLLSTLLSPSQSKNCPTTNASCTMLHGEQPSGCESPSSFLLREGDTAEYLWLLQDCYAALPDTAPPIGVVSLEQRWTQDQACMTLSLHASKKFIYCTPLSQAVAFLSCDRSLILPFCRRLNLSTSCNVRIICKGIVCFAHWFIFIDITYYKRGILLLLPVSSMTALDNHVKPSFVPSRISENLVNQALRHFLFLPVGPFFLLFNTSSSWIFLVVSHR